MMERQYYRMEFFGHAGDTKDFVAMKLIREHDGQIIGAGTLLLGEPVRDMQFMVPSDKAASLIEKLIAAGFKPEAENH